MIRFLLDCGATTNLLPESLIRTLGRMHELRQAKAKLRIFDSTELQTCGVITLFVRHPRTTDVHQLDFYVATKHEQPLLGFKACRALDLLRVVDENICAVGTPAAPGLLLLDPPGTPPPASSPTTEPTCLTETDILTE